MSGVCQGQKRDGELCGKKAKWIHQDKFYCGTHSKSLEGRKAVDVAAPKRAKPKKDVKKEDPLMSYQKSTTEKQIANHTAGKMGTVILTPMEGRKYPPLMNGFVRIYPSAKDKNKIDGFGREALCPTAIGPIKHNQPDLPPAKLLWNFHMSNYVYDKDIIKGDGPVQVCKPEFYEKQKEGYMQTTKIKQVASKAVFYIYRLSEPCKNSIVVEVNNKKHHEIHLSIAESREIYSKFYYASIVGSTDYDDLVKRVLLGYDLSIITSNSNAMPFTKEGVYDAYANMDEPFAHGRILAAMLLWSVNKYEKRTLPWERKSTLPFKVV